MARHHVNVDAVTLIGRAHDLVILSIVSLTDVIEINGFGIIIVDSTGSAHRFTALRGRRQLNALRLTRFMSDITFRFIAKDCRWAVRVVLMVGRRRLISTPRGLSVRRR